MTGRRDGRRLIVKAKQTPRCTYDVVAVVVCTTSGSLRQGFDVFSAFRDLLPMPPQSMSSPSADAAPPHREKSSAGDATKVRDVADNLVITAADLFHAGQSGTGAAALSLGPHPFSLTLLRVRELRGDDDQTQINHEERTDLPEHITEDH